MTDQEEIAGLAESYLKSLIAEVSDAVTADFDSSVSFGELGIDSFYVLKIIKRLEDDFGSLPKTLLFENFNVSDLAGYFIRKHPETLSARIAEKTPGASRPASRRVAERNSEPRAAAGEPAEAPHLESSGSRIHPVFQPVLISEKDARLHAEIGPLIKDLFARYKNEGSASRGTRNIAPNLFIGGERKGYFNYGRCKNIILAYAYTGPNDYFPTLVSELYRHCVSRGFELNILAGDELGTVGDVSFSSTPFGALQRILDLRNFTLSGQKMRRLRYQVSKFSKSGDCRTEEFFCGSDPEGAKNIADIIDQWCAARTMVNPLIHDVKEEILEGRLDPEHRIFVTYNGDVLQNAILISPLSREHNGYLMDLEFYPKTMPLGGLEFAIVNIIETLIEEGCDVLSLGGTYGCKLWTSSQADPEVDRILDDLRMQNIFNDEGNLQFKNKFRPENNAIFLCRPMGECDPENVIDIVMMIADPARTQTSDAENYTFATMDVRDTGYASTGAGAPVSRMREDAASYAESPVRRQENLVIEGEPRSFILSEYGYNPVNIPHEHINFDLKTDSWAQLATPELTNQMRRLRAGLQQHADLDESLRAFFPFEYFVLTTSGRAAEKAFYNAWPEKGIILQNLLFPTTIFHQIDKGFTPHEIPHPAVFKLGAGELYKGNLNWSELQNQLQSRAGSIALVCVEMNDNAAGGYPVSIAHLKAVKALLAQYSIPLVVDGTRVLENACFVIESEAEYTGRNVREVAREIFACADAVVASLTKDFCVDRGGIIATNDAALFETIRESVCREGEGLDAVDRKLIALSMQSRARIETQILRRMSIVRQIWRTLKAHNVPLVGPAAGHCVVIDVKQIPEFRGFRHPVASFLAWLYLNTGIRGGGHNAGMQKNTVLNGLVRLAVPVGLTQQHADDLIAGLIDLFAEKKNIPEVVLAESDSGHAGDVNAEYSLRAFHNLTGSLTRKLAASAARPGTSPECTKTENDVRGITGGQSAQRPAKGQGGHASDIAVVGMAGRYPKARNLREFWDNLLQGRDCIEEIPDERMAQRLHNKFTGRYRGGFIGDVDRFDAGFFNISPNDAATMDPQERLFLEVVWETMEDAGYYPETLGGEGSSRDIGVFVGAVWSMYQLIGLEEKLAGNNVNPSSFFWSIANRVSYWMDLRGPSLTLDTACSASLTAMSLACEAIWRGECPAAIVGGVNLDLHQSKFDINWSGGSLSHDGVCRPFGDGANGYVSGEGVGALFLKPLTQAIEDGDNIHGLIKSASVAHSGRTSGYMMPSPVPQTGLILKSMKNAGVDATSIGYVEAHGTGTELGDSIEISGLAGAFEQYDVDRQSCPIGTVKANIGHLEAASGIVGVQKVLLQMKHRKLVPSLHSSQLNKNIDFESSPFRVQQQVQEWPAKQFNGTPLPRRAGVSAFGAGGTNAHIVLEEYERESTPAAVEPAENVFPLSARTEGQLKEAADRLRRFLEQDLLLNPATARRRENDIAYTLRVGRKCFDHRLAIIAATREELIEKLAAFTEGRKSDGVIAGHVDNADTITAMLNDDERRDFVNLLVRNGDPRRLSRLWCDGVIPDWRGLEIGGSGRRTSLPTYPFADERYWIGSKKTVRDDAFSVHSPASADKNESRSSAEPTASLAAERSGTALVGGDCTSRRSTAPALGYEFTVHDGDGGPPRRSTAMTDGDKARIFTRQLFADRLAVALDAVDENSHLMDTGVTSIDMAEMTQCIKTTIDPAFSPTAFFECTTIKSLSELLFKKYESVFRRMTVAKRVAEDSKSPASADKTADVSTAEDDKVDKPLHVLDAESELALPDIGADTGLYEEKMSYVLLTGATGFLGIHILSELLGTDSHTRVFCLTRADDKEHGLQRILEQAKIFELTVDESRISVLCGDIAEPGLGLSDDEWELCCREVQQIIHASARVNHIEGYATFRESTRGMKEVIRMAGTRRLKLIQFISSTAGCTLKSGDEFSVFDREDFVENGELIYGGYGQSKWVQETFLKRAHGGGIPYVIYRFGELSGSSRTGLGQTDDMLHRLLQMRLAIGCRQKISSDVLDMLPVDFAAGLITGTGGTPSLWNNIVHATHLKPYSFANLYRQAEAYGLRFTPVTREQYLSRCYDFIRYVSSINSVNGFVLECVLRDAEGSIKNTKMMDGYFAVLFPFDQDNFKRSMETIGLELPEWPALIERYLQRWSDEDCGFMRRIFDYQKQAEFEEKSSSAAASGKTLSVSKRSAKDRRRKTAAKKKVRKKKSSENLSEA